MQHRLVYRIRRLVWKYTGREAGDDFLDLHAVENAHYCMPRLLTHPEFVCNSQDILVNRKVVSQEIHRLL